VSEDRAGRRRTLTDGRRVSSAPCMGYTGGRVSVGRGNRYPSPSHCHGSSTSLLSITPSVIASTPVAVDKLDAHLPTDVLRGAAPRPGVGSGGRGYRVEIVSSPGRAWLSDCRRPIYDAV